MSLSVSLWVSDCSAEDPTRSSSDLQSQDRFHQHPGRRAARGDAVSAEEASILTLVTILQLHLFLKWKRITALLFIVNVTVPPGSCKSQ